MEFYVNWVFFIFFFLFVMIIFFGLSVSLNFNFIGYDFMNFVLYFDWLSLCFFFILMLVFICILFYSSFYMVVDLNYNYFFCIMLIFIFSMIGLIFSGSSMMMLIFWDLLGISSYFLVLFYGNWDSCSGAMNTVMMNRLGDVCVFLVFSSVFFFGGEFFSIEGLMNFSLFFFILGTFTKSAQIPFSSWLPKAMSAPTPVSALVHSSTLVTAGLFLFMCFVSVGYLDYVLNLCFFVGLFTMFSSGFSAYFEFDMKKLVALSTLSQIGFCFFGMGLGLVFFSFIHMLSHAIFKSCLFMQMGYIIHTYFGQQDCRSYTGTGSLSWIMQFQIFVSLMCLCGLFFISGSVSKEMVLEYYFYSNWSIFIVLFFFFCLLFTYFYCYRMIMGFFYFMSCTSFYFGESWSFSFSSIFLSIFSLFFLWWFNFNMYVYSVPLLYFDYYSLFYLFMFFFIFFYLFFIFISYDLKYKFFLDLIPKIFIRFKLNLGFLDNFSNFILLGFFDFFLFLYKYLLLMFNNKGYNSFIFILFIIFMI